jgi:hypothetical protein
MIHHLILDPALGVSAEQFAAAWNERPDLHRAAIAEVATGAAQSYDPSWVQMVNLIVPQLALAVAGNALYDLIRTLLIQEGVRRQIRIVRQVQPDGSELTIITIDEEV